ncbi:MAG: hypothetical protein PHU88_06315 [candidate division Zixibacteria bacterium]|nr:hypothetical protein [candidate division Zixibacteria bacterium]
MLIPDKLKIILSVSVLITVLSGCGHDDKVVNCEGVEFYAELVLSRMFPSQGEVLVIVDTIAASFDSAYSPLAPAKPCSAVSVTCNSYALQWQDGAQKHLYTEDINYLGFLVSDDIYIFKVDSGQAVPAFEKSIRFPSVQPILSYPRVYPLPWGFDSVSIASGFTITWTGTGTENVELIICNDPQPRYPPTDTLYHTITENDGALIVSTNDLINVTPGDIYKILLILKNSESVISEGYDPRSSVIALRYTFSNFYAIE